MWGDFLPMVALFFFMAFVNTIIDSLKDTLVVTSVGGGPQVIPFLTVYAVFPSSLLFFTLFSIGTQVFSRAALFNISISAFIAYFALFGGFLYPNHDVLHATGLEPILAALPPGLAGLGGMIRNWTFTTFYCISELWGDVVLSLMFWGLANDTTPMDRAKVLYPLFGIGANVAQVFSGKLLRFMGEYAVATDMSFRTQLQILLGICVGCSFCVLGVHAHIMRRARAAKRAAKAAEQAEMQARMSKIDLGTNGAGAAGSTPPTPPPKKKKKGMKFAEAMRFVTSSPQIRMLAVMSLSQGVCTTLLEFAWKSELRRLHPTPQAFSAFMGDVAAWTGITTVCLMLVSPYFFSKIGWTGVASTSPKLLLYGGTAFFVLATASHAFAPALSSAGFSGPVLAALAIGGAALYVLNRGCKFSLFKPAEEMVYIMLDKESRTKGKAAIDVVGAQTGKSSSSILQQLLLLLSAGNMTTILPVMMGFQLYILRGWLKSVVGLGNFYNENQHKIGYQSTLQSVEDVKGHGPPAQPAQGPAGAPSPS
ncbi:unnamed protein product [Pedinophyceae sp. YPF-701]|nr:unnamed protein product [Pedinophyceae sp. YPF-701]